MHALDLPVAVQVLYTFSIGGLEHSVSAKMRALFVDLVDYVSTVVHLARPPTAFKKLARQRTRTLSFGPFRRAVAESSALLYLLQNFILIFIFTVYTFELLLLAAMLQVFRLIVGSKRKVPEAFGVMEENLRPIIDFTHGWLIALIAS